MVPPMKTVWFQSVGGASGDMVLGALAAIGADLDPVQDAVNRLPVEPVAIRPEAASSHGLNGVRVRVDTAEAGTIPHRTYREIADMIEAAGLSARVTRTSLQVFHRIAEAEARVHAKPIESIHFHEVGALDSIADIVGACVALEQLGIERVHVAPLPVGQGTVTCAHGVYPSPAPATALLLEGFPVVVTGEPHELVTPTGAALLTTWHAGGSAPAGAVVGASGLGFGHRRLDGRPNVLRATILEAGAEGETDTCVVLECQVDDTTPELIGSAMDRLLASGALDAYCTPVQMKKQRPGTLLTVLGRVEDREKLVRIVFEETTTFGMRERVTERRILARSHETVSTPYGDVRIKIGRYGGDVMTAAPEMDDCIARANEQGVPVRTVYEAARTRPA